MDTLKFFLRFVLLAAILLAPTVQAQDTPPPRSDTIDNIHNFLACKGNKFSLCYYSGPDKQANQDPMPCVVGAEGSKANCRCYAYENGKEWNFVSIGSILNPAVRAETQADNACGMEGEKCLNLGNMSKCKLLGKIGEEEGVCKSAPVCDYLGAGGEEPQAQTLYPDLPGDYSISTFSFRHSIKYPIGSTPCSEGLYAGCMTAPCKLEEKINENKEKKLYSTCECPTFDGEFQIGQTLSTDACNLYTDSKGKHVWSAANVDLSD